MVKYRWLMLVMMMSTHTALYADGMVHQGRLNLSFWNPATMPELPLTGYWRFYWRQLLRGDEPALESAHWAVFESPWNEQYITDEPLPNDGFASYVIDIQLPEHLDSLALLIPAVYNSYAVYVNGAYVGGAGLVGTRSEHQVPRWSPQLVVFPVRQSHIRLSIQIANFQHTTGGAVQPVMLGTVRHMRHQLHTFYTSGQSVVVVFIIMAVAMAGTACRIRQCNLMRLALVCLAMALRFMFSDLYIYQYWNLPVPWIVAAKIELITIPIIWLTGLMFLAFMYPDEFGPVVKLFFFSCGGLLIVLVMLLPPAMWATMLWVQFVLGIVFIGYTVGAVIRAAIVGRGGALWLVVGVMIFLSVAFYNIFCRLNHMDINRIVVHVGYLLGLCLCLAGLIGRYFRPQEDTPQMRYEDYYCAGRRRPSTMPV